MRHLPCATVTYSSVVENHVGMEKIGNPQKEGFTIKELKQAQKRFEESGIKCEYIDLDDALPITYIGKADPAAILVARGALQDILEKKGKTLLELQKELFELKWDDQAVMYGRQVTKRARHNLCFTDKDQKANLSEGKGTVVAFTHLPCVQIIREALPEFIGGKAKDLNAEGNFYFNSEKCGIGFHGDAERVIVIGAKVAEKGVKMPLDYQWFHERKPIGDRVELSFDSGDLYVMSHKATGNDWKKRKVPTLRHAAGAKKYRTIKKKVTKKRKKE